LKLNVATIPRSIIHAKAEQDQFVVAQSTTSLSSDDHIIGQDEGIFQLCLATIAESWASILSPCGGLGKQ
jgi:hypothetical protein